LKSIILVLVFALLLNGDEIKRIESIVEDITKLRVQYQECQESLESLDANDTNTAKSELDNFKKELQNSKLDIENLKSQIKSYEKLLKTKEKQINKLRKSKKVVNKVVTKVVTKIKKVKSKPEKVLYKVIKKDKPNDFPNLVLKDKYIEDKVKRTKAYTYELKGNAYIYNAIGGKKIEEWEVDTAFTSNIRSNSWVKITGFFINKSWVKAESNMWINAKNIRKK
jgi:septal ring factor EnvC (AmiA/AmiB activator)